MVFLTAILIRSKRTESMPRAEANPANENRHLNSLCCEIVFLYVPLKHMQSAWPQRRTHNAMLVKRR